MDIVSKQLLRSTQKSVHMLKKYISVIPNEQAAGKEKLPEVTKARNRELSGQTQGGSMKLFKVS